MVEGSVMGCYKSKCMWWYSTRNSIIILYVSISFNELAGSVLDVKVTSLIVLSKHLRTNQCINLKNYQCGPAAEAIPASGQPSPMTFAMRGFTYYTFIVVTSHYPLVYFLALHTLHVFCAHILLHFLKGHRLHSSFRTLVLSRLSCS